MTNSKTKIPKHLAEDIKGFEEIFGNYVADSHKTNINKETSNTKLAEHHELQHFLELEIKRLTFIDNFLSKKVSILKNFSQTKNLIIEQNKRRSSTKESLLVSLGNREHRLHQNLRSLMKAQFDS